MGFRIRRKASGFRQSWWTTRARRVSGIPFCEEDKKAYQQGKGSARIRT